MVVKFSNIDFNERPILILKNASDTPLGVLGYAKNVSVDLKYNETSNIEFEVPEFVNGEATPFYNDIAGMRTVELQGIGQFTLISPSENGDGVQRTKACKGYSLEYEFVYKKISLPENTYKFWDEANPGDTLLGMIMELMPSWSIGSVTMTLHNKYRTFEVNNENLYNLIKGTVQKSYGCIFDFDTITRKVYVRDAIDTPVNKPVFLSLDNLAKEIEVTENTEDIFTRLDVNGAEGVTIRDVNPTGTNKIINLDFYMTDDNFSPALIAKYNEWKRLCAENRQPYYIRSVQYAVKAAQKVAEMAKLTDLQGEMTSLENLQAVAIEGIAQGLKTQEDLDEANVNIAAKQTEINAKQEEIDALQTELESIYGQLEAITKTCNFEKYFSDFEYKLLDRYIKDGEITESSFVVTEVSSYENAGNGKSVGSISISFNGCSFTQIDGINGSKIYDIRGGEIVIPDDLRANVISAIIDRQSNGSYVATAYLSSGTIAGNTFPSACVSLTGNGGTITTGTKSAVLSLTNGYRYFTLDASEYEKRSVAWELYEYGEEALNKLAVPSYSFNVTSANFLVLEEFIAFKNALTLGEKIYIDIGERGVLRPIAIGVRFSFDDPSSLELLFSDSYTSGDSKFRLIDLLEQSISMGKNVEMSKFIYSSFVDSGASTGLREFMTSALDVAKNAIMSSTNQAISWDGAGFRLRKWTNESHTAYEPEQIWMNNNSIVMTENNWATAQMAIGKFHDENLGDCWGIVAPRIVGTLLAGGSLVIESAKRDGGTAVFRVDGDGCKIFNSDLSIAGDNTHIALNPRLGFVIGEYPVYSLSESGVYTLNEDKAKFWVDPNGNLHFKGTLHAANGDFTGAITATSLTIKEGNTNTPIHDYVDNRAESIASPIRDSLNDLIDTVDGEVVIYYATRQPTGVNNKDIWYNTSTNIIKRYEDGEWIDITGTTFGLSLQAISNAQSTADGKIVTFAQASQPTAAAIGDLWIDTDDNNRLRRWNGSGWISYRDGTIATAQSTANAAKDLSDKIYNGATGIYFSNNSVGTCVLNNQVGLKITGSDGTYFQVKNRAMGFFNSSGTPLLYYENGNMVLTGTIAAKAGYIGGEGGWIIGTNCMYNGGASAIGTDGGVFLGTTGISVSDAIIMEPSGSFVIRGDNQDKNESNFVFKVEPTTLSNGVKTYTLYIGDVIFDGSFVLPVENGGLGGIDRDEVSRMTGLHFVTTEAAMNNIARPRNGDLCVLYSNGENGSTIEGVFTTSTTSSPGYLPIGRYGDNGHKQSNSYFGYKNCYWNIANLANENVSSSWARVGVGHTVSGACALYVPLRVTLVNSTLGVSSVTINFLYNTWPSGASRDKDDGITTGITVALCNSNGNNNASIIAKGVFKAGYTSRTNAIRSGSITLSSSIPITNGEYYVVFYSRSTHTLLWIQPSSVSIPLTSSGAAAGLYLRTGGMWRSLGIMSE